MKDYILFIESNTSGSGREFIEKAKAIGFETLLLTNDIFRYPWAKDITEYAEINTNDIISIESWIKKFKEHNNVKGILTSSEFYVQLTSEIAQKFNLPGSNPEAVRLSRTKNEMRRALQTKGLATPLYCTVFKEDDILQKMEGMSFPLIVKPVSGSGSENVRLCHSLNETKESAEKILSLTHNARNQENPNYVLVEEYIDGQEFSVEIFCTPEPKAITVVQKHLSAPPFFLETGHDVPANLPKEKWNALVTEAEKAVSSLGLSFGCIHVELRLSKKGPVIIEVNPRLAGGMLPNLIKRSYGVDLVHLQILSAINPSKNLYEEAKLLVYSSFRFLIPPQNGKISSVENIEEVKDCPSIVEAYVDSRMESFRCLKGDFTDRIGAIIACDKDQSKCISNIEKAKAKIEFHYEDLKCQKG
jgi:argininosuccinate lyase